MAKNWAIAIGINQYDYLQPLNYAKRDALLMQEFLGNEVGFEKIFFFSDDSPPVDGKSTRPTRTNLLRVLRQLFDNPFMGAGDNFWFFFSGHGIRYADRDYLMPCDGDPEDIENTAIPINFVSERLRRCGADNIVLILDACRNEGKKTGEGIGRQTAEEARQQGVISIFSCIPQQYSYEIEALQQGAFTTALLEGLGIQGQCATVERLEQYLKFRVPELVRQYKNTRQTPYVIAEPVNKSHLILVPRYATLADIATLKNDAYQVEVNRNLDLAEQLWIRVLAAASGQDMDAVRGLQRIERLRNSSAIPDLPEQTIPQASKSVTNTPISKPLQTPPKETSPITNIPTSGTGQFATSTIPTPPAPLKKPILSNWSRRRVITVGFAGAGLGLAIVIPRIWRSGTTTPKATGEPTDAPGTTPAASPEITRPPNNPNPSGVSSNLKTFRFETVTVNAQGSITNRRNEEAKYFEEDLGNGVTLEMMQIPGGTFMMGSPEEEAGRYPNESPQHQVKVPGFFMGKYEITQAQYQAIMGKKPSNFIGEKRPVEQVNWDEAVEFCKKLSQKKTEHTYRLPSEAEWEYACRAGTKTPFYFGETITTDLVNYHGNYPYGSAPKGEYREQTIDVGKFPPNSFGLYDMHGNVWEWCLDVYNDNYQGAPKDGSAWLTGKDNNIRLLRGGGCYKHARYCRSAERDRFARAIRYSSIGFRVVAVAVA
ncbi:MULTISPECIES: SUMF1/EgtB/PvdO family nonheme iron enzyme [unclassified Nostoc]|uniref:SUMF1/EgtB/PvdO family nonheme iron enzyme n=1 Tax=unclassified Nostoc TaxID=2593658 RepID=UPI002AD23167|nr:MULTISPECIES: SUMF1/EgtB/PvdO family nonheme iron enzyme [unclassified Nostoc]MDZ8124029.1 SUMF1/EgtB/PvdO family nonheme iron enzyme [Nostoc sp. CmiVER01]MDZ8224658.1 SUMF1/EgtB/PvdO family nonheme iron enzyme [Nostoc sp. ChiVER01]